MQFYKIEGLVNNNTKTNRQDNPELSRRDQAEYIGIRSSVFNSEFKKDAFFFVGTASRQSAIIGGIARSQIDVKQTVPAFLQETGLALSQTKISVTSILRLKIMNQQGKLKRRRSTC